MNFIGFQVNNFINLKYRKEVVGFLGILGNDYEIYFNFYFCFREEKYSFF